MGSHIFWLCDWLNWSQLCYNSKFHGYKEKNTVGVNPRCRGEPKPASIKILDWLLKKASLQLEHCSKMWVRSEISCFILYKDVIEFSWASSGVVVSLIDQLQDLDITREPNWKVKDYRESKLSENLIIFQNTVYRFLKFQF